MPWVNIELTAQRISHPAPVPTKLNPRPPRTLVSTH